MRALMWLDRNIWAMPVLVFVGSGIALFIWQALSDTPILLRGATGEVRQQFFSSLSSTASALLGFSIASVAIIASFSPRKSELSKPRQVLEGDLSRARSIVAVALLTTSFFLLVVLVTATYGISLDPKHNNSSTLAFVTLSAAAASLAGLLAGGGGLALAVMERTRSQ